MEETGFFSSAVLTLGLGIGATVSVLQHHLCGADKAVAIRRSGASSAQSTTPDQRPASSQDEIVVILNPAVSSEGLAYLASKTIPVQYRTKTGESLAAIAKQRYGVAARFRASLRELNATLAAQLARKGEDLMWAKLPKIRR